MSEHLESDSSGIGLDIGMEEEPQPVHLGEEKQIIEDSDIITAMDEISEIVSAPDEAINLDIKTAFLCIFCSETFYAHQKLAYHEVACVASHLSLQNNKYITRSRTKSYIGTARTNVSETCNSKDSDDEDSMYNFRINLQVYNRAPKMPVPIYKSTRRSSVGAQTCVFDVKKKNKRKRSMSRRSSTASNFTSVTTAYKNYNVKKKPTKMCAMFYGTIPSNKFLSLRIEELVDAIEKCNNSLQTTRYISLKKAKYELELLYRQKEETKEESSFRIKDPFECPFCDSIANKDTFDCHTLRHYPFECAFCYKSFRNESVLHHHYEHYHKFSDNSNDDDFIKNLIRRPIARIISRRHYIRELPKISQYSLFGFDEYENDLEIEFNSNIRPDYQGFRYDTPVSFGTEETPFLPSFTRMFYSSRN